MRRITAFKGGFPKAVSIIPAALLIVATAALSPSCGGDDGKAGGGDVHGEAAAHEHEATIWTCSMHPDIRMKEPGKCPICFMDLIPLEEEGGGGELDPRQLRMTPAAVALASIETAPAARKEASATVRLYGLVVPDESLVSRIEARFAGRLEAVYVDYAGEAVSRGEKLADIYSPALLRAQEEFLQAGAALSDMEGSGSEELAGSARRTYEAAGDKLRLYGLTGAQVAAIEKRGKAGDRIAILSPIAGTVLSRDAVEGSYVKEGSPLFTVADLSRVWIDLRAYQSDLPWLRVGQEVVLQAEAVPGTEFAGRVSFIDPVLDGATRTAGVRVEVPNGSGVLKPDMFVSGSVRAVIGSGGEVAGRSSDGGGLPLVIPDTAPLMTGTRAVVYVRIDSAGDPVFEGREVVLGPRTDSGYVVLSGLSEGERVVVSGAFKIDSELQIRARPSMMSSAMRERTGIEEGLEEKAPGDRPDSRDETAVSRRSDGRRAPAGLTPLYDAYFDVQMALAGDDLAAARKAAGALAGKAGSADTASFAGRKADEWKRLSGEISKAASSCSASDDIAACRAAFDSLSAAVIELHTLFGHAGDKPYFLTFCPMANSNEGAFWLQEVDTVYNSHYGAAMLRCGEIRERLDPDGR